MISRIQHSLSAKLIILFIGAGAILLLLVGSILGKGFSRHFRSSIQPFMVHYVELMQQELGSPPQLQSAQRITREIPVDVHVFGPDESWTTGIRLLNRKDLVDRRHNSEPHAKRFLQRFRLKRLDNELILQTRDGDYEIYYQIHDRREFRHGGRFSWIILLSILGVLITIYYATRSLFKPIEEIEHGVNQFGLGNLNHRISKRRDDQLGDLTDSVNNMAEDISNMLEAKRQLLLGISHELRSPLTRSKINLALLEDSPGKTEIDNEIQAMDQLINELLESERLNSPHKVIQTEELRIDQLLLELFDAEFDINDFDLALQHVSAEADPIRIKLLVRNLLQNALKYNLSTPKKPRLSIQKTSLRYQIRVQDYGQGISPELIPFLTEPFYRADPSRQRQTGGYGLGLYLCRMIVEAHYGNLKINSEINSGTEIICSFPLKQ